VEWVCGIAIAVPLDIKKVNVLLIDKHKLSQFFRPLMYQSRPVGLEPDSIAYPVARDSSELQQHFFQIGRSDIDRTKGHHCLRTNRERFPMNFFSLGIKSLQASQTIFSIFDPLKVQIIDF